MFARILEWLRRIVDKRICTLDDFKEAYRKAEDLIDVDQDGYVSIKECGKVLVAVLFTMRKG